MHTLLLFSTLALVSVPDREEPGKDAKAIEKQILGEWESIRLVNFGEELDLKLKIVFFPKECHVYHNGKRQADEDATYVIDARKMPATMDIFPIKKGQHKEVAIFKLDGDQLTVCAIRVDDGPRPIEFQSPPNSQTTLVVFRRVRK